MTKRIVLCADDYGQAPAISQGIITLLEQGRLSATSCMVNSPYWPDQATWLKPFQGKVDIGLHFNLTEGKPLSDGFRSTYGEQLLPLKKLMCQALLHQLVLPAIVAECQAQLTHFTEHLGVLPDFIDGHQHIQHLPIVRQALLQVYALRLRTKNSYLRLVKMRSKWNNIKKIVIATTGTQAFERLLDAQHIPHNTSFSGVYSFAKAYNYPALFPQFLAEVTSQGIIMCHPGLANEGEADLIAKSREVEYRYFASEQFLRDCRAQNVMLERFLRR